MRLPFDFTLRPEHFRAWDYFREKRLTWATRRFELRDDLLSEEHLRKAYATLDHSKILRSARRGKWPEAMSAVDWALEQGPPPGPVEIVSRHEREGSLQETLKQFTHGKLAVEINDFEELARGTHGLSMRQRINRFFRAPKMDAGVGIAFCSARKMPIHYYREDEGSALDQPLLWETVLRPKFNGAFAAVLGSPVWHSRSPLEHLDFLAKRKCLLWRLTCSLKS